MNHLVDIRGFPAVVAGLLLSVAAAGAGMLLVAAPTKEPVSLQATIDEVSRRWPQIGHVTPAKLAPLLKDGQVLVFDVREEPEYQVSHLPGAIRISPESAPAEFLARFGTGVKGKTVVFYCSVGMRSSQFAARVAESLRARGAEAVNDLAGGIFAWHNEGRTLVDAAGPTPFVHPYDVSWGRLLTHQNFLRTLARR
jgi:rhodanese-related sulfurtransferase